MLTMQSLSDAGTAEQGWSPVDRRNGRGVGLGLASGTTVWMDSQGNVWPHGEVGRLFCVKHGWEAIVLEETLPTWATGL